ncbi:MAG: AAA family ATPase [Treponema sp.]|jgi:cytidylate kinase|nr:AAA family ATPase [Treponema sp.]
MLNNKKLSRVKIAISGKSGCGNTTVSRLLAGMLKLRFINFTFRSLALEKGIEFNEVLKLAAKDDSWDKEVDLRQVEMAREDGGCVLGSRLAIWMLPEADLKIFLNAKLETRAMRIQRREGGSLEEITAFTKNRDEQDHGRYQRIYNLDNNNYSFVDLVIDTDDLSPAEIAEKIIAKLKEKCALIL